jgi:hypothetical protein
MDLMLDAQTFSNAAAARIFDLASIKMLSDRHMSDPWSSLAVRHGVLRMAIETKSLFSKSR